MNDVIVLTAKHAVFRLVLFLSLTCYFTGHGV
jgi:hypothetical protein